MKVTYFPNQPHCYAFGGFEVQMLAAYNAVKQQGYDIDLLNPWSRQANFDIAHIWGLEISQFNNIIYSKKAGKKVIVTDLLPDLSTLNSRLKFRLSTYIYKARILKELSRSVDYFIALTDAERKNIAKYYNFPKEKIKIIPNIVAAEYFKSSSAVIEDLGIRDFVLCVGNICKRKNQLNLIEACNTLGLNVLLLGNLMVGEEAYGEAVLSVLQKNVSNKWIKGVKENSDTLISAYKQCVAFALLSHHENQPISVLEAIAMKCKVLLADRPYAHQGFYKHTLKADPDNIKSIREGLTAAINTVPENNSLIQRCTTENVGKQYIEIYNHLA